MNLLHNLPKALLAIGAAVPLISANANSGALFESDAHVFEAVAELGSAWRTSPVLVDRPRPQPPKFMPYRFDKARAVFVHRDDHGQINRIVLSDLGCWEEGRESALRVVMRISGAQPEEIRYIILASTNVFDGNLGSQSVQAAPALRITFQRFNKKSRCGIDIEKEIASSG